MFAEKRRSADAKKGKKHGICGVKMAFALCVGQNQWTGKECVRLAMIKEFLLLLKT